MSETRRDEPVGEVGNEQNTILILAPLSNDARLTTEFLHGAGLHSEVCENANVLSTFIGVNAGALLIAEEAIDAAAVPLLKGELGKQPKWSDLPIVIITGGRETTAERGRRLEAFGSTGNVVLIERPFRPATLVSTLTAALRSRRRQFQVRDLLEMTRRDAGELRQSEERYREADRRKDEFLAMLAHELRNPLSSVGNAVTLLKESELEEHHEWAAEVIARRTRQLARLVDDLLDVSRITRGKIDLRKEMIDAEKCLRSACEVTAPMLAGKEHTLHANIPRGELWLEADPARLEQITVNLLANAAKYSEPRGQIWIEGRCAASEIVITVRDTGIGIAPEKIPEMFELFAQGERTKARSEGGLGIGLTVVRRLCELHGGTVSASSAGPGTGSTFEVRLPAVAAQSEQVEAARTLSAPANEGEGVRVLVVDDNVDTATGLARLLARRGYRVEVAHDGNAALEIARRTLPEAVFLDIGLPGMDGYEVAKHLRAAPDCAGTLIVALSGYGQENDRKQSRAAGIDYHIVKPVEFEEIRRLLSRALSHGGDGRRMTGESRAGPHLARNGLY